MMASKKAKAPPPARVSSFAKSFKGITGTSVSGIKQGAVSNSTKPSSGKSSTNSAEKAIYQPAKITSKAGFDREVEKKYDLMLAGDLEDLPHLPRSIVRIFLSSTFSDMRAERNMLAKHVFPTLRHRCGQVGLDFQVVDLRWGLTSETENDHSGTKVCLQEIQNCQDVSLGPNFVAFLGHRYGMHRPLMVEIPVSEFEVLLAEAKSLNLDDVSVVETWYQRDDNALPPMFVLQPIRMHYPHYGDMTAGKEQEREKDLKRWSDTMRRLQGVLQKAADSAYKAKKIPETSWRQHFMSVTDYEIMKGVVNAPAPNNHTVFFTRDLTGLDGEALKQRLAEKYIDITQKDEKLIVDKESEAMITDLIKKVQTKMGKDWVIPLSTAWQEGGIDPEKFPEHKKYIDKFCNYFLDKVTYLITQGIDLRQAKIRQREWYTIYNEALHHLRFCNSKCESFCGRDDVLKKAKDYILDPSMRKPFIIHAPSGAGKTSVMAMIMKCLGSWLPDGHVGIIRFLGTSPLSLYVYNVLFGVVGQLADNADIIMERLNYRSWKKLKGYAPRLMRRVAFKLKTPTVILLDSLDQLDPSDDAYAMDWLPAVLPTNLKIIVSTLPKEHGILDNLRQLVPDQNHFCAVPLMPEATGQQIINKYLKLRDRTVTEAQMSLILKAFSASPSPLYLKLLMDQAVRYPSFLTPDPASIPDSIIKAINNLFDELEIKFGPKLVQCALGLLTVGLNGLTDIELEDALSCCDDALDEVYKFHDPPVPGIVRIPPVMWARIRYDLREYLVERLAQGKTTLFWYHRQFIETATARYASGKAKAELHAVLFELFRADDGVKKSITLSNRKNLFVADADRQTTPQPMNADNVRKLECMMYHLMHMQDLMSADDAKRIVFTNFDFLSTKLAAAGEEKVLKDFEEYLKINKDEELVMLKKFMDSKKNSLCNPRSFAFNLIACLAPPSSFKHLLELRKQAENVLLASDKPQLVPSLPCLAARPGDPSLLMSGFLRVVDQMGDCLLLESESVDEDVTNFSIVNVATSEVIDVLLEANVSQAKLSADGQGYVYLSTDSIKSKKSPTAKEFSNSVTELFKGGKLVPKTTTNMGVAMNSDASNVGLFFGTHAAVASADLTKPWTLYVPDMADGTIHSLNICGADSCLVIASGDVQDNGKSFCALWKSGTSKPQGVFQLDGTLNHPLVSLTLDDQFFVGALVSTESTHSLVIFQTQPFEQLKSLPCEGKISQIRASNSAQVVAILSDETHIIFLDVASRNKLEKISHKTAVSDFDVSWEDDRVILADKGGEISIYTRAGKLLLAFLGHSQGISTLRYIADSITITTCSGMLKTWDAAAVSTLMATSASEDSKNAGESESLNSLTSVVNAIIDTAGQDLITFSSAGDVVVWKIESLEKTRSFNIGIRGDVVLQTASSVVAALEKERKALKMFDIASGKLLCEDIIPQHVITCITSADRRSVFTLSEQPHLVLHRIDLDGKAGHVKKTLNIQLGFAYVNVGMTLSTSGRYMGFQVKITEKDYKEVEVSWKKGANLSPQRHPYRFAAIDLNGTSGHAMHCFRPLTKIPHLGIDLEPYTGNTMLVATRRWLIFWDIPTGKCDQRMSKTARKTMFYRPDWVKAAAGANISMALSSDSRLLAVGSEDGYMFVYEYESGMPVGMKAPATKHQAPVSHVCVTPDNSTVLSVCHNGVLKMWTAASATQVATMRLGAKVRCLRLSSDGCVLVAVTDTDRPRVAVFRLHKGKA